MLHTQLVNIVGYASCHNLWPSNDRRARIFYLDQVSSFLWRWVPKVAFCASDIYHRRPSRVLISYYIRCTFLILKVGSGSRDRIAQSSVKIRFRLKGKWESPLSPCEQQVVTYTRGDNAIWWNIDAPCQTMTCRNLTFLRYLNRTITTNDVEPRSFGL